MTHKGIQLSIEGMVATAGKSVSTLCPSSEAGGEGCQRSCGFHGLFQSFKQSVPEPMGWCCLPKGFNSPSQGNSSQVYLETCLLGESTSCQVYNTNRLTLCVISETAYWDQKRVCRF